MPAHRALLFSVLFLACPPGQQNRVAEGTGVGGSALSCKPDLGAVTVLQASTEDNAAGKGRLCPDCLAAECLLERQDVFGTDAGIFQGACGDYLGCVCACSASTPNCQRTCLREYDKPCQNAAAALDACRRRKCAPPCIAPALLALEKLDAGAKPDAGILVEGACRQPPRDGGSQRPCCDALGRCCNALVDGGEPICMSDYGMYRGSEPSCEFALITWAPHCPSIMP